MVKTSIGSRRGMTSVVLTAGILFALPIGIRAGQCRPSQIRIAVVHADAWSGYQTLLGVQAAVDGNERVCVTAHPYRGDQDGADELEEVISSQAAHLILGPTDSGAYLGAFAKQDELRRYQVPVISPLVTAAEGNQADGWFFRTNVNNQQRIAPVRDTLAPFWISSLGVLYADTGFGRGAEEQFRDDLATDFPPVYVTAPFEDNFNSRRQAVKTILEVRPEAVGIFALAQDLPSLFEEFDRQTKDLPYKPIYFTIVDARPVADSEHPLFFVAATSDLISVPNSQEQLYEVGALAFDTTQAVLATLGERSGKDFNPSDFREEFVHLLQTENGWRGPHTGMHFHGFRNRVVPKVFQVDSQGIREVKSLGYWERVARKFQLVHLRFGNWPFLYAGVSVLLCLAFTIIDVKRKYEGKYRKVFRHMWIYLLCLAHIVILIALLLLLGESGTIRYDDYIAVLALAVAPTTLFRTTFLETQAGKSLGIGKYYDMALSWLNQHILDARHPTDTRRVAVLAYYNTDRWMKQKLFRAYDQLPQERKKKLRESLERKLEEAENDGGGIDKMLRRRKICARRLLRWYDWKDLYKSYVPSEFCVRFPQDPETFIGSAVERCAPRDKLRQEILEEIRPHLADPKRPAERALADDIPAESEDLLGHELYAALQFLVMQHEYKPKHLVKKGWLVSDSSSSVIELGRRAVPWLKTRADS